MDGRSGKDAGASGEQVIAALLAVRARFTTLRENRYPPGDRPYIPRLRPLLLALGVAGGLTWLGGAATEDPVPETDAPATWVTTDDYPAAAIAAGWEGSVATRLSVDRDGRITACAIESSSGHALLDRTACDLLRSRGRFSPRLDGAGRPIAYERPLRFTWRLPQ